MNDSPNASPRLKLIHSVSHAPRGELNHGPSRTGNDEPDVTLRRVALVTGNYTTADDGAAKTLHRLVDALTERGVRVAVVAPDHGDALPPAKHIVGVPSIPLPVQGYRLPVGLGRSARRQLEAFDPQLVHVASPDPASVLAIRWAKKRGLPVTSSFHTNFASYFRYWGKPFAPLTGLAWRALEKFYAPCDRVFVPTDSMGEELQKHGVLEDYAILARGVDGTQYHPRFRSTQWRAQHGIGEDDIVVLFCARIVWEKGLRTLVETFHRLRARFPRARFVVAGDGEQLEWLRDEAPYAVFTGFVKGEELSRAYASADLFLYPSTTDTFGNVTLEAMASGLPVIGANAPGTRSLVPEGEAGLLVEPDDPGALTEAAAQVIRNEVLRRRLSRGALRRARQFRWPTILDDFVADLRHIAGEDVEPSRTRAVANTERRWGRMPIPTL